jgi:hypothetical protein
MSAAQAQAPNHRPNPDWANFPPELWQKIALLLDGENEPAETSTAMRLVCRSIRDSLQIGIILPAHLSGWDLQDNAAFLSNATCSLVIHAPNPDLGILQHFGRVQHLEIQRIFLDNLSAVGQLTFLRSLKVSIAALFKTSSNTWLSWASSLRQLTALSISSGDFSSVQPSQCLSALAPLSNLRMLEFRGCFAPADAYLERLRPLSKLRSLRVHPTHGMKSTAAMKVFGCVHPPWDRLTEVGLKQLLSLLPALEELQLPITIHSISRQLNSNVFWLSIRIRKQGAASCDPPVSRTFLGVLGTAEVIALR